MKSRVIRAMLLALGWGISGLDVSSASEPSVFGVFVGSSPCGGPIRQLLRIPTNGEPELIEWKLTLYQDAKIRAPSRYELQCKYGLTAPNQPGLAKDIKILERQGACIVGKGTKSNPDATVYELNGAVSLAEVDKNILHVLNPDRTLMTGSSGWSYTLNRAEHAEKPPDRKLALSQPDMSYQISPLATGPTVFGVFEGRSPCQGIARELKRSVDPGSAKVKWRVTLYQNAETREPTTYKVEGSLHRRSVREGNWSTIREQGRTIYRLEGSQSEADLLLLKGDENVLFFLNQEQKPLVGNADFSYTLNRRSATPSDAPKESAKTQN